MSAVGSLEMARYRILTTMALGMALHLSAWSAGQSWELGSRLTLVTSAGATIVGVGTVGERGLDLTLEEGFSGFAILVLQGPDGSLTTFDVVVEADGDILIEDGGEFADFRSSVADAGLTFRIDVRSTGGPSTEGEPRAGSSAGEGASDVDRPGFTAGGAVETGIDRAREAADDRVPDDVGRVEDVGGRVSGPIGGPDEAVDEEPAAPRGVPRAPAPDGAGAGAGAGQPVGPPERPAGVGVGAGGRNGRD